MNATQRTAQNRRPRRTPACRERGVALVITLGLLGLLAAASLAVVMLTSSDTMINGYYRSYRGSFYAADSGVNVVAEAMNNSVRTAANPAATNGASPLPIGSGPAPGGSSNLTTGGGNTTAPAALTAAYQPFMASAFSVGTNGSWNGQFKMVQNPDGNPVIGPGTYSFQPYAADSSAPADGDYEWKFSYPYEITVQGQSSGTEAELITETGEIVYASAPGVSSTSGLPRFSNYGAFITNFALCQGALVPGSMSGPFFTDGSWNFGNFGNPGYTFMDSVGQAGADVGWFSNGRCTASPTPPKGFRAPTFDGGFQTSAPAIQPPTDSYSQAEAVMDGEGTLDQQPTNAQMNKVLKTDSGTAFPSAGGGTGVYIPFYTNPNTGKATYGSDPSQGGDGHGGGFYVNGNASVTLSATTTNGDPTQTYTITQGSTVTTIVVDNVASTTTVSDNVGGYQLLQGTPQQFDGSGNGIVQSDPSNAAVSPTMVYVNGQITGLSGTVQNDTGITVTSPTGVDITGNLTYLQSPVSIPADTLNSGTNAGVLGVFTNGNINLYPAANGNLTVDASLAAIGSASGTSGFATPGAGIGTWTILGGRAEDQAHGVNIGAGNTYFDRRFNNSFGPPWFATAKPQNGVASVPQFFQASVQRLTWKEASR